MLDLSSKKPFALVSSGVLSAKENMRIDKALYEAFKDVQEPTFRVYEWEESFTYGVSQNFETIQSLASLPKDRQNHAQRMTGGGILFHGNDISYSLIIPTSYVKNLSVKESYELLCGFLIHFYRSLGLKPVYAKDVEDITLSQSSYCQQGFEPYDILVEGKKVGGNAQRRSKLCIFQHGSIAIDNSVFSMGNSLEDVGVKIGFDEARALLVQSFADTFNVVFKEKDKEMLDAS